MQWYYAVDSQRRGPVGHEDFERLVHEGAITPETLVWRRGMTVWRTLAELMAEEPDLVRATEPPALPEDHANGAGVGAPATATFQQAAEVYTQAPGPVEYGGFWRRVAARLLDGMMIYFISQVVIGIVGALFFGTTLAAIAALNGREPTLPEMLTMLGFLGTAMGLSVCTSVWFDWFFMRRYDATPGKLIVGLRVYRADGSSLSTGRILGRHFAHMLNGLTLGIGYIMAAFDGEKRALHDHVCDTRVVRRRG